MEKITAEIGRDPVKQAILIFGIATLIVGVEAILFSFGAINRDPLSPWITFTSFILFFALTTCVLSLRAPSQRWYWNRSILSFIGVVVASALFGQLFSGLSINEAGSFRWLFIVMSIGYLVFMSIVRLMRRIMDIVIKQDERLRGGE